jgi:hypothetical protein
VNDALSPRATVTIGTKTLAGKTVKTLPLGKHATGKVLSASFRCTLARGKYRYYVSGTDLARNAASSIGWNSLTVK